MTFEDYQELAVVPVIERARKILHKQGKESSYTLEDLQAALRQAESNGGAASAGAPGGADPPRAR